MIIKEFILDTVQRKPHRWFNGLRGPSSVVNRGFNHRSGQPKDYEIGIWCFFAKQAALRRKSKDWLARNQDNVSGLSNMTVASVS